MGTREITIDPSNSCDTCKQTFETLADLIAHLECNDHFPHAKHGQINLFECPFDNCGLAVIVYGDFKKHVISHLVQEQQQSSQKVVVKIFANCEIKKASRTLKGVIGISIERSITL